MFNTFNVWAHKKSFSFLLLLLRKKTNFWGENVFHENTTPTQKSSLTNKLIPWENSIFLMEVEGRCNITPAWNPSITISSVIPKHKSACKMRQMPAHISDAAIFPRKHDTHPSVNRVVKGITKSFFSPFFSHFIWALLSFTEAFCGYGGFVWFIKFSWLFSLEAMTLNHTFV